MNEFIFYDVDTKYVNYLKAAEIAKRGFTRVPDIECKNEREMAENTYYSVISGNDISLLNASCDFKFLEKISKTYVL